MRKQKTVGIILFILLLVFISSTAGCDRGMTTVPDSQSSVSNGVNSTEGIPPGFIVYTDEMKLFSISYPSSWEACLSAIPDVEEGRRDVLASIDSDIPLQEAKSLFFGGCPKEDGGYLPSVQIVVDSTIGIAMEKYSEDAIKMLDVLFDDFELFEQTAMVVGGMEAMLFDYAYTVPEMGRVRLLTVHVITGNVGWHIRCGTLEEEFPAESEILNDIVRSFRILI